MSGLTQYYNCTRNLIYLLMNFSSPKITILCKYNYPYLYLKLDKPITFREVFFILKWFEVIAIENPVLHSTLSVDFLLLQAVEV